MAGRAALMAGVQSVSARAYGFVSMGVAVAGALAFSHVACRDNPCCPSGGGANSHVLGPQAGPSLVVRDAVSGAPLCAASGVVQCSGGPTGACTVTCTLEGAPQPCDQQQAGTYNMSVVVAAPGYKSGRVTIPITLAACGVLEPGDSGASTTLTLVPQCMHTTMHANGLGQSWTDCTPAHTYDQAQASTACDYYPQSISSNCATAFACGGGDGQAAVCTIQSDNSGVPCACWTYQGPGTGHVRASNTDCECASTSDPAWY